MNVRATMLDHALGIGVPDILDVRDTIVMCPASREGVFTDELAKFVVRPIFHSRGQADTILQGLAHVPDGEVLIVNCDQGFAPSILTNFIAMAKATRTSSAAIVFEGNDNPAYSYIGEVRVDTAYEGLWFYRAVEKTVISKWAMAGAYWFRSARELAGTICRSMLRTGPEAEPYLSECFEGMRSLAFPIANSEMFQWGTPEDLARDGQVWDLDAEVEMILRHKELM